MRPPASDPNAYKGEIVLYSIYAAHSVRIPAQIWMNSRICMKWFKLVAWRVPPLHGTHAQLQYLWGGPLPKSYWMSKTTHSVLGTVLCNLECQQGTLLYPNTSCICVCKKNFALHNDTNCEPGKLLVRYCVNASLLFICSIVGYRAYIPFEFYTLPCIRLKYIRMLHLCNVGILMK